MTAHNEKIVTVKHNGKEHTANHTQLCERFNVNRLTFASRLKVGWSVEQALEIHKRPVKREAGRMGKRMRAYFLYKHKPTEVEDNERDSEGRHCYTTRVHNNSTNPIHI